MALAPFYSCGGSCFVSYVDEGTVHKGYEIWLNGRRRPYYPEGCEEDLAREYAIYKHLGKHDRILQCFGLDEIRCPGVHALRLELAPLGTNLLLFDGYRIKIGDFGGSIIEGRELSFPVTVAEEAQYDLPCCGRDRQERPIMKRELFALGSCMYEVMAWTRPFQGLRDSEVTKRYEHGDSRLWIASQLRAIWNCWHEVYDCADEVVESLKERLPSNRDEAPSNSVGVIFGPNEGGCAPSPDLNPTDGVLRALRVVSESAPFHGFTF
ncbi:hypothetical protein F5X99DRAFT_411590 [Biscogniauxia marginata]|nr:hypothetical protein F5X99DRAFT_411590 [Biscogniauxia marginata]